MENTDIYRVLGGKTLDAIRHHIATSRAASEAIRALLPEFGATKVILHRSGAIDHFEFPADPDPKVWKGSRYIARPRANTKAGKDLQARLTMMPRRPNWEHFTQALTGDTNLFIHISDDVRPACTWGRVRFVTPDESSDVWFLLVDREPGKPAAWTPPAEECAPMKLSEYYAAVEAAEAASKAKQSATSEEPPQTTPIFVHDDRGNVVDFFSVGNGAQQVARLDREAEVNGKRDQYAWDNWAGGEALEVYARSNGFGPAIDEARKLQSAAV